ncbi:MAG TPA: DnaJ domain-containing protein [Thermoanaerobaculia bacterium]|nr:DnaJ domain-containing protein [Thermoanaerobaculia bacterium]
MPAPDTLPDEVLRLLQERIARSLDERPLILDPVAHRERVAALVARLGSASFYELLGLDVAASPDEVHTAYEEAARLLHPRHAPRVGLGERRGTLELLFERATRAYLTLSVPDRRKRYDREMMPSMEGAAGGTGPATAAARAREQQEMARAYFERARVLAEAGDIHSAIELLELAIHAERRPEYYHLLGDLQAKNPYWLEQAADSYRRAQALGAKDPALTAAIQSLEERLAAAQAEPPPPAR